MLKSNFHIKLIGYKGVVRYGFASANTKVCYYEVLGVTPTATPIEIKKAYYEKVKIYHPDTSKINNSEEIFKQIAKAYETLKDPVLRQVYDLGKNNPNFSNENAEDTMGGSSAYSRYYGGNANNSEQQKYEYYYNKWYEYGQKKSKEETIRDEYFNMRSRMAQSSIFENLFVRAAIVIGIIFVYDIYRKWKNSKHNQFVKTQQEILAVGPVIFESPLVFIREKAMDPAKLQEEIRKKEFRIEYADPSKGPVSPMAEAAKKKYIKPKEIVNLNDYIEKRQIKIQKSENEYHNTY